MFNINIDLVPAPSDTSLYVDGTQYLVVDSQGIYHIASWDAEEETLVIPDMVELVQVLEVDPGHADVGTTADSPVPLAGAAEGVGSGGTDTAVEADADAEDEDTLYVTFVAALPEFDAPTQL